jgi:hypothetical protein
MDPRKKVNFLDPSVLEPKVFYVTPLAHTHAPQAVETPNREFLIVDFPGLMDTDGADADRRNLIQIVEYIRRLGVANAFILIINEQSPRFDRALQEAVILLYNSFGPGMIRNCGIVFTRSLVTTREEASVFVDQVIDLFARRGQHVPHIPFWQVDSHPELLARLGVPESLINERHERNITVVREIALWARALEPYDVANIVAARYEWEAAIEEAQSRAENDQMQIELNEAEKTAAQAQVEILRARAEAAAARVHAAVREQQSSGGGGGGSCFIL